MLAARRELDPTESAAERDRFRSELLAARLDGARLRAALSKSADPTQDLVVPEGAGSQQAEYLRMLVTSQVGEQHAKIAALGRQKQKEEQNRAAIAATVQKLTVALPMLRERMEARKYLYENDIGSDLPYLAMAPGPVQPEQEVPVHSGTL